MVSTFVNFVSTVEAPSNETIFTGESVSIEAVKQQLGLPVQIFSHKTKDGKPGMHWRCGQAIGPASGNVIAKIADIEEKDLLLREFEREDGSKSWMLTLADSTNSAVRTF